METDNYEFGSLLANTFKLDWEKSDHGISHWERVNIIGKYLAKYTGADLDVVYFFAYCHDIKRGDEGDDLLHGIRSAEFVKAYFKPECGELSKKQIEQLEFACRFHCQSSVKSDDITIQTCWDADRLDLWRIGIIPDPFFLNTAKAKERETIEFSKSLYENWER